ncbi:DUF4097 family beta strand repeat-containing protein [Maribacter hydrothermalis]|uniref:Adhesin domain-containing protein n=1 Tax=Maribacter hydrothermalis TaxID=1836467 RepID=A0A1B7Z3U5_9FLAO|nr:hypothetical protein [Maribacter hydrothermalis]APQ17122.1 hypothetical protein BTR34_07200 [Maribacter hydrothermalis]OBR37383.1 hypothetical protein A9200_06950 [Maribacter hydrothermalis]
MRFFLLACLFFLIGNTLSAQKKLQRTVHVDHISLIQVNTANCFKVELHSTASKNVNIEAEIEGEYSQDLNIEVTTIGSTLLIEAGFVPSFENPNDKLSAHKVVSIILHVTIPSNKNIELFGTNSHVIIYGEYNEVAVSLSDGNCELNNVLGDVKVKTQSGAIKILSKSAKINAKSKFGKVSFNPIPFNSSFNYEIQTVTGNIELSKTE